MAAFQAEHVDLDPQGSAELPAASEQSTGSSTSAAVLDLWVPPTDDSAGYFRKTSKRVNQSHHGALCRYCLDKKVPPHRQSIALWLVEEMMVVTCPW